MRLCFILGYPPLMKSMYADNGEELLSVFKRMKDHQIATSLDLAAIDPDSEASLPSVYDILDLSLQNIYHFH